MLGIFEPILRAASADKIREHAQSIWVNNRYFDFTHFLRSADYIESALKDFGLETDRIELPADGETRYGDAVMPLAWDCEQAELSIIAPRQQVLYNRDEQPTCIGMWSPATQSDGIEAGVLCLSTGEPGELENKDAKGMFIYTPGRPDVIRELAVKQEAAGIISSWSPAPNDSESLQWIFRNSNIPGGWGPKKDETPLLLLAVSKKIGADIEQLASEESLLLCAKVQSRLYSGKLPMISGLIPGDPGEEEILIYAPAYGQGAHFNAASSAAMLESARILSSQIEAGTMPRPLLGIRFLFAPKLYGSLAFARERKDILKRTRYAINLESGAGNPDASWSRWSYRFAPMFQRHYADGLAQRLFQQYIHFIRPQRFMETRELALNADVYFNDPIIGVPTHWLYGGTDDECRHSSADTINTIDSRSLIDLATAPLAMAYTMASIGIGDMPDIAQWNFNLSHERIIKDLQQFTDRAKEAQNLSDLNELLGEASRHFPLRAAMESKGMLTLSEMGEGAEDQIDWEAITELCQALNDASETAQKVLRTHVNVRADELNIALPEIEVAKEVVEDERVPIRTGDALGTITLDSLPYEEWTTPVKQSPRSNLPYIMAWWLVDGTRNIGQIQQLIQFETTRYRECIPAWFNFLEKHGYVIIKKDEENRDESQINAQDQPEDDSTPE